MSFVGSKSASSLQTFDVEHTPTNVPGAPLNVQVNPVPELGFVHLQSAKLIGGLIKTKRKRDKVKRKIKDSFFTFLAWHVF